MYVKFTNSMPRTMLAFDFALENPHGESFRGAPTYVLKELHTRMARGVFLARNWRKEGEGRISADDFIKWNSWLGFRKEALEGDYNLRSEVAHYKVIAEGIGIKLEIMLIQHETL